MSENDALVIEHYYDGLAVKHTCRTSEARHPGHPRISEGDVLTLPIKTQSVTVLIDILFYSVDIRPVAFL